jgi:phospholipid transport system substrate-binding protein
VDYRLLKNPDRWRVYDVVIEGVSLVNNYRSQFAGILQKSSFEELSKKLRETVRKQSGA